MQNTRIEFAGTSRGRDALLVPSSKVRRDRFGVTVQAFWPGDPTLVAEFFPWSSVQSLAFYDDTIVDIPERSSVGHRTV